MGNNELLGTILHKYVLWINDNIGSGDGTALIREIWKDNPAMAEHLTIKWNGCRRETARDLETDDEGSRFVQIIALQRIMVSLDRRNTEILAEYIANNARNQ